eukprot:10147649-Alexandrium_andersonii.AAC.1
MSASLVGSEMCIRDRPGQSWTRDWSRLPGPRRSGSWSPGACGTSGRSRSCLLYTSDAADDM